MQLYSVIHILFPGWAYASRRLLHFSTIAKNIGTADFRPEIDRSQWEWHACHQ